MLKIVELWHPARRLRGRPAAYGFSLVELLVTIAIVIVLLAILVPVLRSAKESARAVQCQANQVSNGFSVVFHAHRARDRYPGFSLAVSPGNSGQVRVDVVRKHDQQAGFDVFDTEQLMCPSDAAQATVPLKDAGGNPYERVVSYGFNVSLALGNMSLEQTPQPSQTAVLYDGSMSGDPGVANKRGNGKGKSVAGVFASPQAFAQHASFRRHSGQINVLFADWHVGAVDRLTADQVPSPPAPPPMANPSRYPYRR